MKMVHHHHHHHRQQQNTNTPRSQTLPSSPTHSSSSSSSDFEFRVSLSPRKSSATNLCPADDIFYKGQLLPLHLSPRISMVRTLLLSSSSSTSSSSATTARHSSDSHSSFSTDGCDSSRPSSVTDDDLHLQTIKLFPATGSTSSNTKKPPNNNKYFSLSRFSSVFRKETKTDPREPPPPPPPPGNIINVTGSSVKRMSLSAKEMIRKYLKKAKPLYEKLSQQKTSPLAPKTQVATKENNNDVVISHSFSGNLRYPRRRSCVSSCPSSMGSSPTRNNNVVRSGASGGIFSSHSSSMEELQSAIQGAIAHCKNSMTQNK